MEFTFRPMDRDSAERVVAWRYAAPYDFYNVDASAMPALLEPTNAYYVASTADDDLVGFCCFGADARVPGGTYDDTAVDVGIGLRPDLTGRGLGTDFLLTVLAFAGQELGASRFRATIAAFNARSLLVAERTGFVRTSAFTSMEGIAFLHLLKS
jgi:RimJ/RimL family protein N-acetyltransferase